MITYPSKILPKIEEEEGSSCNLFFEANITLVPNPDKYIAKKEKKSKNAQQYISKLTQQYKEKIIQPKWNLSQKCKVDITEHQLLKYNSRIKNKIT